jgi:hypothetical protein
MTEEVQHDINQIQASLTASKVLVAILETLGEVRVETKTLVGAENKDKELIVDYDENGPSFIFRLPRPGDFEFNADLIEEANITQEDTDLINDFE